MNASIINETREVFNHLGDELSKRIFENRLLFSLVGNHNFIGNTVRSQLSPLTLEDCKASLNAFFNQHSNGIIVYGAGALGRQFLALCDEVKITAFCDSDPTRHGGTFCGHKIVSPEELREAHNASAVVITVTAEKSVREIIAKLLELGFAENEVLDFNTALDNHNINLIRTQYFDPDIIMPRLTKNEVFVDAGCFDCDTAFRFVGLCNNEYERIIAFEPNPKQYSICVKNSKSLSNITVHPYGLWDENTEIGFDNKKSASASRISDSSNGNDTMVKTVRLDDFLNGEKVTFIKMDIEGAELNALRGSEQTILEHRPKLAICMYHKPEDILEIPTYILSLRTGYKLFLRHHGFLGANTILYAV